MDRSGAPGLDAELIARFAAALEALWPERGRLGLAVSGGPDSLALLLLAHHALPDRVEAATVDHGLRPESAGEAELVARLCGEWGIAHEVLPVEVAAGNLQDQARQARYAALAGWLTERGLDALATAHHADDQAETFLMRANRGSGLAGLAGVRARTQVPGSQRPLLRPLLGWRKTELEMLVEGCGIEPVLDPSNADDRFDRARMRKALAAADWLDPSGLAESAALLADAHDYLGVPLQLCWDAHVERTGSGFSYRPGHSPFENVEMVARILAAMGGSPRKSEIARMVARLEAGQSSSLAGVLARVGQEKAGSGRKGVRWDFVPEPARRTG